MLTESGGITQFSSISEDLQVPEEINPDKLSLALEPESAAVYSQETVVGQIDGDPSAAAISRPTEYMVIDIGGGTVDITTHLEVDGGIIVQNIPTGNAWGGTKVNKEFSKMLEKILNDSGFERFLQEGKYSQKMATLNKLFYTEFESQKVLFGRGMSDKEISVTLPKMFATFFRRELDAGIKVSMVSNTMMIQIQYASVAIRLNLDYLVQYLMASWKSSSQLLLIANTKSIHFI